MAIRMNLSENTVFRMDDGVPTRRSLKLNVVASFAGRGLNGLLSFLFVPAYVHLLGVESYGLIGFFATLVATLNLLDMGLSSTLNRQLARLSALPGEAREQRDLVRTLESVYWLTAIAAGLLLLLVAPYMARYWVNAQSLPLRTVTTAIALMGLVFVFQFPFGLYQGGLMGLQRHVVLNEILGVMAILRSLGAVGVLMWISPTISAYFIWQFLCSLVQTVLIGSCLWRALPPDHERPRFRKASLLSIWRFAAGMTGIALLSIVLTNLDKILLSKMLPLKEFGYYMVGASVSSGILTLVSPFFVASFPRFSQMIASGRNEELKGLYHQLCQTISCVVVPVVVVIALFSRQVVYFWSHNPDLVQNSSLFVSLLVIGAGMNALLQVPYAFQLASGGTKLAFYQAIVSVAVVIPLLLVLIHFFGAVGGAINWLTLTTSYILITPHIMHRWMLPTEKWAWYFYDLCIPGVGIVTVALLARFFLRLDGYSMPAQFISVGGVWLVAVLTGVALAPHVRRMAKVQLYRLRGNPH